MRKLIWNILTITNVFFNQKTVNVCKHTVKMTWCHLHSIFTYVYSLLIEKDICDHRNISNKFLRVCVCLTSGNLFIFSKSFPFPFPFFVLSVLRYFPFHLVSTKNWLSVINNNSSNNKKKIIIIIIIIIEIQDYNCQY